MSHRTIDGGVTGTQATQADGTGPTTDAPTVQRLLLGARLRRLREARGISAADAARAIRGSTSKISRIELGRNTVRTADIEDLLGFYGVTDPAERQQLLALACQANKQGWWHRYHDVLPGWFRPYLGLEQSADSIRSFDTQFVPSLLQTEAYAAAVMGLGWRSPAETDRLECLRQERQRRFAAGGGRLSAVIDEIAVRRPIGSQATMRGQLEHLIQLAGQSGIAIQVTPLRRGAASLMPCSFSILSFARTGLPDVVYVEQFAGALYLDRRADAERYAVALERIRAASTPAGHSADFLAAILRDIGESPQSGVKLSG